MSRWLIGAWVIAGTRNDGKISEDDVGSLARIVVSTGGRLAWPMSMALARSSATAAVTKLLATYRAKSEGAAARSSRWRLVLDKNTLVSHQRGSGTRR